MKRLLFFFLLIITGFAYGQNPIATKELRVHPRTDSVTVSNIGKIAFDADDDKFRFNDGTGWFSYLKEGATLPYWPLTGSFEVGTSSADIIGELSLVSNSFLGGVLKIGNGLLGEFDDTGHLTFAGDGVVVTGMLKYSSSPGVFEDEQDITNKDYQDTHLGGTTIPAGSTASAGYYVRKGDTNFEYADPAGNGLTNSSGTLKVGGPVSEDINWTQSGADRPVFSLGVPGVASVAVFDSVAMYTKEGYIYEVPNHYRMILKPDSGMVFTALQNEPLLIKYAADYSGSINFNSRTLVDKGYVDTKVDNKFWPLTGTGTQTGDVTISGTDDIGLGITPTFKLHVKGTGQNLFQVLDNDNNNILQARSISGGNRVVELTNLVVSEVPEKLDTAAWVLVRDNSTGRVKRRSASSLGGGWPLTGTADATGDISIDGNDFDLNLGSTNGFDLIRLNTTSGIEKTLVQSSGFKVSTKQFTATILDNTAGQQNVVHTIDVSSPAVAYYNLRITSALAVNTANGRIISCNPFTAIAEMDTGTLSGTSAAPVDVYHGGPSTGGFNVNFNDTNDEIEIRFLNETGTGFQWTISVEYELMIAE